jgi:hypothetical protein
MGRLCDHGLTHGLRSNLASHHNPNLRIYKTRGSTSLNDQTHLYIYRKGGKIGKHSNSSNTKENNALCYHEILTNLGIGAIPR